MFSPVYWFSSVVKYINILASKYWFILQLGVNESKKFTSEITENCGLTVSLWLVLPYCLLRYCKFSPRSHLSFEKTLLYTYENECDIYSTGILRRAIRQIVICVMTWVLQMNRLSIYFCLCCWSMKIIFKKNPQTYFYCSNHSKAVYFIAKCSAKTVISNVNMAPSAPCHVHKQAT